jgi:hypothetical protein
MAKQQISVFARSQAPAGAVYALLRDGAGWPRWSPIDSFELLREGRDGGESLGAHRLFRTGRVRSHEEIVALEPDRRFGYALLSGLPLRGYRAYVELEATPDGTIIHWQSSFEPVIPGTGGFYRKVLGRFIQRCADGLAAYAERPSAGATAPPLASCA